MTEKKENKITVGFAVGKAWTGLLIGEFIATLVPLIVSLGINDGNYYPLTPQFADVCKTELGGMTLQFVLTGLMGAGIGLGTLVWYSEKLNHTKQTLINFASVVACLFPVAWCCHWMPHTIKGVLCYTAIFLMIYFVIWIVMYIVESSKIKKINERLGK